MPEEAASVGRLSWKARMDVWRLWWNVWVYGWEVSRNAPVEWKGMLVRSLTCIWAYGIQYSCLRICLGRWIVRCKQGISRFLKYANSGSNCGVAGWKVSILQLSDLVRGTVFIILCLDWSGLFCWYIEKWEISTFGVTGKVHAGNHWI